MNPKELLILLSIPCVQWAVGIETQNLRLFLLGKITTPFLHELLLERVFYYQSFSAF